MKISAREKEWLLKEKYNGKKTDAFKLDLDRLKTGEPLAYIIGHIPFLNTYIYLDHHPLIPRTETEFWVAAVLDSLHERTGDKLRILDLCAGSGCIGTAVLKALPASHVDFAELDTKLHKTIEKNLKKNKIDETRAKVIGGNLFDDVHGVYDYIFSNPPYINPTSKNVAKSVKKYEPEIALYGGCDGLETITKIISDAPLYLVKGGTLFLEHEPEQSHMIDILGNQHNFRTETGKDQFGVLRYSKLTLIRSSRT